MGGVYTDNSKGTDAHRRTDIGLRLAVGQCLGPESHKRLLGFLPSAFLLPVSFLVLPLELQTV